MSEITEGSGDLGTQKRAEDAILAEKNRVAYRLHDSVTQTLFSVSMIADVLPQLWQIDASEGVKRLAELQQMTHSAILEMQTLLHELRPMMLADTELDELLHQLVEMVKNKSDLTINLDLQGAVVLPLAARIAFYRVAQEALNNITLHADATHVDLELVYHPEYTSLRIVDDGCGFELEERKSEQPGLTIMRDRAHGIRADLQINSQPGNGTEIIICWPHLDKG